MGAVKSAYDAAVTAVEAYQTAAYDAQDIDNNTALESAALAAAGASAGRALAELKGGMADERDKNILSTLAL